MGRLVQWRRLKGRGYLLPNSYMPYTQKSPARRALLACSWEVCGLDNSIVLVGHSIRRDSLLCMCVCVCLLNDSR